ncbi:fluoride efflux transporter CrcB [Allopontixanthobacter sp.]|uniref:fluoride efflux transporter CrcB n=1 Tax=Allopontixanthobacter sp. TaxID=2906452 RepID=UPI002AB9F877|nr:fluoride efflux transporter CrcB [Allopontixanthobacter sp.]MDZ4308188.1 fluoride efflux transporter CrcB [Allopontixanthobacter sp.]
MTSISSIGPWAATVNVAAGGAVGAVLRYQLGRTMTRFLGPQTMTAFPWATLTVNVLGGIAMGVLAGYLARSGAGGEQWRLLLGVGLLGGFTTFSSFSLELMLLIERGQPAAALSYALISVIASLAGLYLGLIIMRIAA